MNTVYEFCKWWWLNNCEWIRIHDPWVIPIIAICIPLSMVIHAICAIVRIWRGR
ncbi:hypothetical protein H3R32_03930 [Commensalibacter sp. B14384M3]|nr:hypothetical protein [Commensalibacter sp. B14384M3]